MVSSDEEEWKPAESKPKAVSKTTRAPATGEKKAAVKKNVKPKEPKMPKEAKVPKPKAPRKPAAQKKANSCNSQKVSALSCSAGEKKENMCDKFGEDKLNIQTDCPEESRTDNSGTSIRVKEEVRIYMYLHKQIYFLLLEPFFQYYSVNST